MKQILSLAAAFCLVLPAIALAAPPGSPNTPTTKPVIGQKPVRPPGGNKPPHHRPIHPRPPSVGKPPQNRPPAGKPPHVRPPHHKPPSVGKPPARPPAWHKPRPHQWFWRGKWINRIRGPVFIYPLGYRYRHWNVGERLPALFLVAQFFYDNFAAAGLQAPPPGYRWVRYGPDLLLVNLRTGEVEEIAYGVFY